MKENEVLKGVILGYRNLIDERYTYNNLQEKYTLPNSLNAKTINNIKNYFLTYVYPDLEQRKALDDAFNTLDNFIKNPEKLIRLVLDSFTLLFTHGKHLRKIFNAGIKAMKSFRGATKFENSLVKVALKNQHKPPFETKDINMLIKKLSYDEIEEFIENTETFFNIIYDRDLVAKIQEVIIHVINKMTKKPNIFSKKEIKGLTLALETIQKGEELLNSLNIKEQEVLVDFVVNIERDYLKNIFSN
ncbi:MAG: hypothetical protein HWD82_05400 [Flavobacteriaceae bacterium]|nr:hypothetical protein [Flavobacteriaceae bacterium]